MKMIIVETVERPKQTWEFIDAEYSVAENGYVTVTADTGDMPNDSSFFYYDSIEKDLVISVSGSFSLFRIQWFNIATKDNGKTVIEFITPKRKA